MMEMYFLLIFINRYRQKIALPIENIFFGQFSMMDKDIRDIYHKMCKKNQIPDNELILSCLHYASMRGELNLTNTTIFDTSCFVITETLKCVPTIHILNLTNCLLTFDSMKYFLDIVNQLKNLSVLYLNGNRIGDKLTVCISEMLLNNSSITELHLDWNNIGYSVDSFAQLCNSLTSNKVLIKLNLANNSLCQKCGFYLAKLLQRNDYLKYIDLSWNCIGETGALLLLESLKNNEIILDINIKGNSVSTEISTSIAEQLNRNKLNEISRKEIPDRNLNIHITSVDQNILPKLNFPSNQYRDHIDELESKIELLQTENQQQKQELEKLKTKHVKETEKNEAVLNKIKEIKSELAYKNESLNSLINKISNEVPDSDLKSMNSLEDLEKIIYIIKLIKKNYINIILKERKSHQILLKASPNLTNDLNIVKTDLKNLKASMEIEIKNYSDELSAVKTLIFKNVFFRGVSNKINLYLCKFLRQQDNLNISDEPIQILTSFEKKLNIVENEKTDLKNKLDQSKTQSDLDNQKIKTLEHNLTQVKDELQSTKYDLNSNTKEIETLKTTLFVKNTHLIQWKIENQNVKTKILTLEKQNNQLKLWEIENQDLKTKISTLEKQFQIEKQKFDEEKKEDLKQVKEVYLQFTQYINKCNKKT